MAKYRISLSLFPYYKTVFCSVNHPRSRRFEVFKIDIKGWALCVYWTFGVTVKIVSTFFLYSEMTHGKL